MRIGTFIIRFFLPVCILFGLGLPAHSQNYRIQRYGVGDGLAQGYIYDITQDKLGFLWLATGEGVSRFDGARFKNFNIADGLAENFITEVFVGSDSVIWFGHQEGGITRYEGKTGFQKIETPIDNSSIRGITEDKNNNIWVATQRSGILRIDRNGTCTTFKEGFEGNLLYCLISTTEGNLLIGSNEGVILCSIENGKPSIKGKIDAIPDTKINYLSQSLTGESYLVGTEDAGIFEYFPAKKKTSNWLIKDGLRSDNIQAVFEDKEGFIWIAFFGKGYSKFDRKPDGGLREIGTLNPNPSLENEFFRVIFQDSEGQIWFGTYGHGLVCLRDEIFTKYTATKPYHEAGFFCILQEKSGGFWAGTDAGLMHFSPEKLLNQSIYYSSGNGLEANPDFILGSKEGFNAFPVTSLFEDKNGILWIGTEKEGVFFLSPGSKKPQKLDLSEYSLSDAINYIRADSKFNLWIATKNGLFITHSNTGTRSYFSTMEGLPHNNVVHLEEGKDSKMWIGTQSHTLTLYDNGKLEKIRLNDSSNVVSEVSCLVKDTEGNMWVGTKGEGLYKKGLDNKFTNYTSKKSGLLSDYVYFLTVDKKGNVWAGHRAGVSKFIPATGRFILFDHEHGFPQGEINSNAVTLDQEGNIWMGTINGFIKYNPIKDNIVLKEPNTFISSVLVDDLPFDISKAARLPYRRNRIKFEFLGLTFKDQEKVRYEFKLEGNDLKWSEPSSENSFTYQGLSDGDYTFLLRACNAEGVCNLEPVRYSFIVVSPIWKQWWFIISMLVLTIAGTLAFVRFRTARLAQEKEILEIAVTERTLELKEEKEKVLDLNKNLERLVDERTQELARTNQRLKLTISKLDTFIYRASHDLKQPVTSILGLVNVSRLDVSDPNATRYFSLVETSAQKLDRIVIDLIEVTRITQGKLTPESLSMNEMIQNAIQFSSRNDAFSITEWNIEIPENLRFLSDKVQMECILQHTIDNAVKFAAPLKEKNLVSIAMLVDAEGSLHFSVEDNGTGMRPDAKEKAFEMFYKGTKNMGTGLGLYLAKSAVQKMAGEISLTTKEGSGTTLEVSLEPLPENLPEGTTYIS